MITNVKRGADPELFLVSLEGTPVSSIGLVGGSKQHPRDIGGGYAVQEDNVAVEFNIPPASSEDEFVSSIHYALDFLVKEMAEKKLNVLVEPIAHFDKKSLSHPKAKEMGCEPDYNAWTMEINPRPKAPKSLRSAGGHLHLSWDDPDVTTAARIIKVHDLFCGVPSVLLDSNVERRSIYGKAGACRFKSYGVEYRTPSNFWIKSKEMTKWMYEQSEKAIKFLNEGNVILQEDWSKIINCINNSDKELVEELNHKYSIL